MTLNGIFILCCISFNFLNILLSVITIFFFFFQNPSSYNVPVPVTPLQVQCLTSIHCLNLPKLAPSQQLLQLNQNRPPRRRMPDRKELAGNQEFCFLRLRSTNLRGGSSSSGTSLHLKENNWQTFWNWHQLKSKSGSRIGGISASVKDKTKH